METQRTHCKEQRGPLRQLTSSPRAKPFFYFLFSTILKVERPRAEFTASGFNFRLPLPLARRRG
jgi:hypothetical protein